MQCILLLLMWCILLPLLIQYVDYQLITQLVFIKCRACLFRMGMQIMGVPQIPMTKLTFPRIFLLSLPYYAHSRRHFLENHWWHETSLEPYSKQRCLPRWLFYIRLFGRVVFYSTTVVPCAFRADCEAIMLLVVSMSPRMIYAWIMSLLTVTCRRRSPPSTSPSTARCSTNWKTPRSALTWPRTPCRSCEPRTAAPCPPPGPPRR